MTTNLSQAIEAILFATAQPHTFASLANILGAEQEDIVKAVEGLATSLSGHGITVTTLNQSVSLVTVRDYSYIIENMRKDELSKELSKASAETLAIIAYTPGVSKSHIEFIRGVNVSYSLRSLSMRGLIESKGQGRAITYHPTSQLLQHFGITHLHELPRYAETKKNIDALLTGAEESTQ